MKLKISAIIALALASSVSLGAAEKLTTSTINVYSATPLPSLGLPLNIIPANIQIATPKAINAQAGVSLADYMSTNMQSVSVTEMGGNPWQPEVTFRGYSASPLLGMPQGMSTYVDGVRVNEPFGDVTLWDKIPNFAIGGMQLVPGSNPMYGLNTLGGAIAIQTKSGRQAQGVGIEAEYGSWNRQRALVEYGGVSKDGSMDFYIGHQTTKEDGWRQFSPSHLNQTFAKTGWQSEKSKIDLSYIGTDNKLIGNGFTPEHMLSGDRDQIHTRPDWSNNYYHHLALNGSHWVNNDVMLSGNAYYRKSNRHTKNGDLYESDMEATGGHEIYGNTISCTPEAPAEECELVGSALNTTHTKQNNFGFAGQAAFNQDFMGKKNQFIVGAGFDYSKIKFKQNEKVNLSRESEGDVEVDGREPLTEFVFDASREPILSGNGALPQTQTTGLTGKQWTASLFATDTLSLNDKWHLNAGARYNHTKVDNDDTLRGAASPQTLTAVDDYKRLNPSVGITHTPTDKLSIFGTYSESSRAPTSIELGCSNPDFGCLLPSAMADDPPLKQVVAKTYDFGARGSLTEEIKWNASIYHAMNHQDLQFIRAGNSTSRGFYSNVGRTQRQGLDLGLSGQHDQFKWSTSYSYIRATFDSNFSLVNSANSSAPNSINDDPDLDDPNRNIYEVRKGNRMPSIPTHQFKARLQYDVTPKWSVGSNLVYFSEQYVMGNENNKHQANTADCLVGGSLRGNKAACGSGKISDYTVVNLDTQYNFGGGWKAFAKAINIFDNDYYVAGRLAETMFDASGAYGGEIKSRGVLPGAPRAAWIGVRYEFGGAPEAK